jgi:hypothetical protein
MKRTLLRIAWVLVIALLATSPRALLAPTATFNRSMESKRPKVPKNVVRSDPVQISDLEKAGQSPPPPRREASPQITDGWLLGASSIQALPRAAFTQLTKPDYLQLYAALLPQNHLDPPA